MNDQPFYTPIKMMKRLHGKYWHEHDCYLPALGFPEEENETKVVHITQPSINVLKELKRLDTELQEHSKGHSLIQRRRQENIV